MRDHRELRVFRLADLLLEEVYEITEEFPKIERYTLTSQLRRAALSIPGNIAEGCGRSSEADLFRFIDYAVGSARETGYYLDFAIRRGYLSNQQADSIISLHHRTSQSLGAFRNTIQRWKSES